MKENLPLLSIICLTYNHEKYVRKTLEGFISQMIDFEIEIIVHDDASTDSTVLILKEYEKKYVGLFHNIYREKNYFSLGKDILGYLCSEVARGKYIAICEGDDYWIDPHKLQRQVDFLESHDEYTFTCHKYLIYKDNKHELLYANFDYLKKKNCLLGQDIDSSKPYWIQLLSLVCRRNIMNSIPLNKYSCFRDVHLFHHLLLEGKGCCFEFIGGVYRHHQGGISSEISLLNKTEIACRIYKEIMSVRPTKMIKKNFSMYAAQLFLLDRHNPLICLNDMNIAGFFYFLGYLLYIKLGKR